MMCISEEGPFWVGLATCTPLFEDTSEWLGDIWAVQAPTLGPQVKDAQQGISVMRLSSVLVV